MIRRGLAIAAALHIAYALTWVVLSPHSQEIFERYMTALAMGIAAIFYAVLIVAFYKARKSRLNIALVIQKIYWELLITLLALPVQLGLIVNDVPYRSNPIAIFSIPGWVRTYVWIGISVAIIGVLYEFWRANWGEQASPWDGGERRADMDRRAGWGKQA